MNGRLPRLSSAQCREIAGLHARNIHRGFLSSLGTRFLFQLYRAIDQAEDAVVIPSVVHGRVIGFVSGTTGMRQVYTCLLRRFPSVALSLVPKGFRPGRMKALFETLAATRREEGSDSPPSAELLSLAVDQDFRGNGNAEALYARLVDWFRSKGVGEFKIVVGEELAAAHRFYSRMGAVPMGTVEIHAGSRSIVYKQVIDPIPLVEENE